MYLPFTQPAFASFIDTVRLSPTLGPSCLNLYEEANTDRPWRVGFDLEFELSHALKDGTLDHKARAEALWPVDPPAVAASAELFLSRVLVNRILPAFNQLAGTAYTTRDVYALDSSTSTKLSFHLATPALLPTKPSLELFAEWMRATFESGLYTAASARVGSRGEEREALYVGTRAAAPLQVAAARLARHHRVCDSSACRFRAACAAARRTAAAAPPGTRGGAA